MVKLWPGGPRYVDDPAFKITTDSVLLADFALGRAFDRCMDLGCGGGVMRDVFAGSPPYIFVKHFYATASLLGAVACLLLWNIGQMPAMLIGAAVTLTLRLLAAHYRWSLPKAK